MKTVNFAVLGCGKIGTRHAAKIKSVDYVRLAAVCDIIPERAQDLAEKHVCKSYSSIDELVRDPNVDFINICTPSGLHPAHSIRCLEAGKNVLCEKPMALTVESAMQMISAANRRNRLLYTVKQNRYNPPVKLVKQLLDEGKLGRPIMCMVNVIWNRNDAYYKADPWRGTLALDGGTIYTQAIHFVDLMLMFMGPAKSVFSRMGTLDHDIEIEDTGTIAIEFSNGAFGSFNFTTCATKKNFEGSITLVFSNGTIRIGGEYINTIDYFQVNGVDSYELEPTTATANDYGTYRGSMSNHDQIFQDIVRVLNDPKYRSNLVLGRDCIDTISLIEAAKLSAANGRMVELSTSYADELARLESVHEIRQSEESWEPAPLVLPR